MRTRSQVKRDIPESPLLCFVDLAVKERRLPAPKAKPRQPARKRQEKHRRQPKSDVCEIIFNLPWETYRDDLIRISRDELARLSIQSLEAEKFSKRKGPMCCQCCWKIYKGAYELKRHYGTHLLKKTFKCGSKACGYMSTQKDNCRAHCRKLRHKFIY